MMTADRHGISIITEILELFLRGLQFDIYVVFFLCNVMKQNNSFNMMCLVTFEIKAITETTKCCIFQKRRCWLVLNAGFLQPSTTVDKGVLNLISYLSLCI